MSLITCFLVILGHRAMRQLATSETLTDGGLFGRTKFEMLKRQLGLCEASPTTKTIQTCWYKRIEKEKMGNKTRVEMYFLCAIDYR